MASALRDCAWRRSTRRAAAPRSAAIDEVRRIERKYSRYRDDSIVSRINAAAGGGGRSRSTTRPPALLDFAGALHAHSDGLFDITSGVLRRAWDFRAAARAGAAPSRGAAAADRLARRCVRDGARIRLPRAGMELDFGGFGKEYAADRAPRCCAPPACGTASSTSAATSA